MSPLAKDPAEVALGGNAGNARRSAERAARRALAEVAPGIPTCPDTLSAAERAVWDETIEILAERNALTEGDGAVLEVYCRTKCRWVRESIALEQEGTMLTVTRISNNRPVMCEIVNPRVKVVASLEKSLQSMFRSLGLDPRSRKSVKPAEKPKGDAPVPGSVAARRAELRAQGY